MARQSYGLYRFNKATMANIYSDKKGYHWKVSLYPDDAKDGKGHNKAWGAKSPEDAGNQISEYLEENMARRPMLMKTYRGGNPFPSEIFTEDKDVKNFTMAILAQNKMGQEHQLTPGGFFPN